MSESSVAAQSAQPGQPGQPGQSGQSGEPHAGEPHQIEGLSNRLNWLRAGVLGANDGIVSVAGLVMGVAAASDDRAAITVAGVAALAAGALSMGAGEYVSVSTQRDAEVSLLDKERTELREMPEQEYDELVSILVSKGISEDLSTQVATQLTERDALAAHARLELGLDPDDVTNPWKAAAASMISFTVGGLLPVCTILLPDPMRFYVTVVAVLMALALTGWTSARLGYANPVRAVLRNMAGGAFAMGVTWIIGSLVGTTVG